ncbi:MAG: RluA family pseudouridine synthase [Planctomycetaceae bacterium]|nr:RluA family pseudouridine synthase [Planctomycetaceae bacterium]
MKPPRDRVFHVSADQGHATVAALLRQWLPGESWGEVRRMLAQRHVQVNGNLCFDAGRRLKPDDVVKLLARPAAAIPTERDVRIRYLDEHVIVVEKPSGLTSIRHFEERDWAPRRKQLQPTLDELLPRLVAAMRVRGVAAQRGIPRPVRPVHRLDRETSGLMVFARTIRAERSLGEQFRRHTIERCYLALAAGVVGPTKFESYLCRDRGDGRRGSTPNAQQGKHAVTHVKPLERLGDFTLVECKLETGRTHQIRIHLSEAGHPVCGDKVYFTPYQGPPRQDHSGAPRLALHAGVLGFAHPLTGEALRFEMPLPQDLEELVNELRQSGAGAAGRPARARKSQGAKRKGAGKNSQRTEKPQ